MKNKSETQKRRSENFKKWRARNPISLEDQLIKQDYNRLMTLAFPDAVRAKRKRHSDKNPHSIFGYYLKRNYGITYDQYQQLLQSQGGRCAICGSLPIRKRLATDHCHKTGRVRGLLCAHCNQGIGHFRESTEVMQSAIEYISRNQKKETQAIS